MKRTALAAAILAVALMAWPARAARETPPASAVIDAPRLLDDLRALAADDMQGREVGTPGGAKARAYVMERFRASGIMPFGTSYEQAFTFGAERKGVNVIGRIEGTSQPDRYIVVSAHYDHLGVRNGQIFPG